MMIELHILMFELCSCIICAIAAVIDIKKRIIPNSLVICIFAVGLLSVLSRILLGEDISGAVSDCVHGALTGLIIMLLSALIIKGGVGGGDIKLICALGFVFGFENLFGLMIISFICAALFGFAMIIFRRMNIKSTLPLAPFTFIGCTAFCLLSSFNLFFEL